jgi:hypothetical protein
MILAIKSFGCLLLVASMLGIPRCWAPPWFLGLGPISRHLSRSWASVPCLAPAPWPWLHSSAPFLGSIPRSHSLVPFLGGARRSHSSASAVLCSRVPRPWLHSSFPFFGPVPRPWLHSLVPFLGSISQPHSSVPFLGLGSALVLDTKPQWCSHSSTSAVLLGPRCPGAPVLHMKPSLLCSSASVLSSGNFLICHICHPFHILHFAHSTSTSLTYLADRYFSPLLSSNLCFLLYSFFASFPFTIFPFDNDSLQYKINLITFAFSNQTKF